MTRKTVALAALLVVALLPASSAYAQQQDGPVTIAVPNAPCDYSCSAPLGAWPPDETDGGIHPQGY
jgi:hypothetical protein